MRQRCSLKKQCVNPTKHENSHHKRRAETRHKTKGKEHPHQKQASQRDKERATLILLISLPYAFIMKRDLCSYKIISKEGGEIIMERD